MTTEADRDDLIRRHREALAEVARLSQPDDRGAGERTARLAGLAAWQAEADRLRALLDAADPGEDADG